MENLFDIPKGEGREELVFKTVGDREIYLTFIPPEEKKYDKAPVYFVISGGGWHTESRQSMLDFSEISIEKLRKEGYAVASVDYRVYSEEKIFMREIISDCFDGIRYIAHFADILGIDKYNIVTSGHSAGGHLALMLAYAPEEEFTKDSVLKEDFCVTAVAALSPPTALYKKDVPRVLGFDPTGAYEGEDSEEERRLTSPITYVTDKCPPTLLCAGTSDYLVYPTSSEILYDKLLENNVDTRLELSIGGGHVFEQLHKNITPSPSGADMQDFVVDFVLKHKK